MGDKGEKGSDFIIRADNGGRRWRLRRGGERERREMGVGINFFFFLKYKILRTN